MAEPDRPPPADERRWRVMPALPVLKFAGAILFGLAGVAFDDDPLKLTLAALVAAAFTVWGARDVLVPIRVAADAAGVTVVAGFARRRRLPWSAVERVRVDTRPRLGLRTETLEIDAGDSLYLFSAYDLGAPPAEVAEALETLRTAGAAD
jgi:hypothetical protein